MSSIQPIAVPDDTITSGEEKTNDYEKNNVTNTPLSVASTGEPLTPHTEPVDLDSPAPLLKSDSPDSNPKSVGESQAVNPEDDAANQHSENNTVVRATTTENNVETEKNQFSLVENMLLMKLKEKLSPIHSTSSSPKGSTPSSPPAGLADKMLLYTEETALDIALNGDETCLSPPIGVRDSAAMMSSGGEVNKSLGSSSGGKSGPAPHMQLDPMVAGKGGKYNSSEKGSGRTIFKNPVSPVSHVLDGVFKLSAKEKHALRGRTAGRSVKLFEEADELGERIQDWYGRFREMYQEMFTKVGEKDTEIKELRRQIKALQNGQQTGSPRAGPQSPGGKGADTDSAKSPRSSERSHEKRGTDSCYSNSSRVSHEKQEANKSHYNSMMKRAASPSPSHKDDSAGPPGLEGSSSVGKPPQSPMQEARSPRSYPQGHNYEDNVMSTMNPFRPNKSFADHAAAWENNRTIQPTPPIAASKPFEARPDDEVMDKTVEGQLQRAEARKQGLGVLKKALPSVQVPGGPLTEDDEEKRRKLLAGCLAVDCDQRTIDWFMLDENAPYWYLLLEKTDELQRRRADPNSPRAQVRNPSAWLTKFFNAVRRDMKPEALANKSPENNNKLPAPQGAQGQPHNQSYSTANQSPMSSYNSASQSQNYSSSAQYDQTNNRSLGNEAYRQQYAQNGYPQPAPQYQYTQTQFQQSYQQGAYTQMPGGALVVNGQTLTPVLGQAQAPAGRPTAMEGGYYKSGNDATPAQGTLTRQGSGGNNRPLPPPLPELHRTTSGTMSWHQPLPSAAPTPYPASTASMQPSRRHPSTATQNSIYGV